MTFERIKELRELESGYRDPDGLFPEMATRAERLELIDEAEAWLLLLESKRAIYFGDDSGWHVSGYAPERSTPQAAVLAALRKLEVTP